MLPIITSPNPILKKKAQPIKTVDAEILKLIQDMMATCRKSNGIGLAAPQVGKSIRLCVIDLEHLGLKPFPLINPKLSKKSWKKIDMEEGCLSVPGIFGMVKRPEKIKVTAENYEGKKYSFEADGILARVIQHEVDHLDGILFVTKMYRQTTGSKNEKNQI
jgi:peptide deformylase